MEKSNVRGSNEKLRSSLDGMASPRSLASEFLLSFIYSTGFHCDFKMVSVMPAITYRFQASGRRKEQGRKVLTTF
jgi:hypothetical protein